MSNDNSNISKNNVNDKNGTNNISQTDETPSSSRHGNFNLVYSSYIRIYFLIINYLNLHIPE